MESNNWKNPSLCSWKLNFMQDSWSNVIIKRLAVIEVNKSLAYFKCKRKEERVATAEKVVTVVH